MKNEALKLADELDALHQYVPSEAPAMIRRLVEELDKQKLNGGGFPVKNATYWKRQYSLMSAQNDRLKSGIYHANEQIKYLESLAPQTKPLSDEEIEECYWGDGYPDNPRHPKEFARAIEERHGIK